MGSFYQYGECRVRGKYFFNPEVGNSRVPSRFESKGVDGEHQVVSRKL